MSAPDFSQLIPDVSLTDQWISANAQSRNLCITAARWGAQYAAERLAGRWPEAITDRLPTEADGDANGKVQYLGPEGLWWPSGWGSVAAIGVPWQHTSKWQPKPLTEPQQIAAVLRGMNVDVEEREAAILRAAELLEALQ